MRVPLSSFLLPLPGERAIAVDRVAWGWVCLAVAVTSVPEAVVTGIPTSEAELTGLGFLESPEVMPATRWRPERRRSCSPDVDVRALRKGSPRWRGRTGAGGMLGAGWEVIAWEREAR